MKQKQNIDFKLPIFSWLFFLFLSSGVSDHYSNLQFGKSVLTERVDQFSENLKGKKGVFKFSLSHKKSSSFHQSNSQFFSINQLSGKLDDFVQIVFKTQSRLLKQIPQNIIFHFRSRSLTSNTSDDFSDFIS